MLHPENYQQALTSAKAMAKRDLVESEYEISFIAYVPDLSDYCLCAWKYEKEEGWIFVCQMLPIDQRLPDEEITDTQIQVLASSGQLIMAVRLYRGKYNADLSTAKRAIDRMLNPPGEAETR
jgi:hypothetical protein